MYQDYKLYDSIDFENLTGKFWIKTSGNYNSKRTDLKQMGLISISKIGERKCLVQD